MPPRHQHRQPHQDAAHPPSTNRTLPLVAIEPQQQTNTDIRPQVLRYSALCFGVLYGFYHQRTITTTQRSAAAQHEWERKEKLISDAKKAYAKSKQQPAAASTQSGGREWFSFRGWNSTPETED